MLKRYIVIFNNYIIILYNTKRYTRTHAVMLPYQLEYENVIMSGKREASDLVRAIDSGVTRNLPDI